MLLLAAVAIAGWFYAIGWRPSLVKWPRQGIDIAHHEGAIDWPLVKSQHVAFAYLKASEGGSDRDSGFSDEWRGADSAGIARGAYHVFTLCTPGAEQAANFIAAVPDDPAMLAPAVDLEFGGNCTARPRRPALIGELGIFIRAVEAHFHKPVILYLTRAFDAGYGVSAHFDRRLWLRSSITEPGWGGRRWSIWQASSFAHVAGIDGAVDWDVGQP